jgi:hypothetical protein
LSVLRLAAVGGSIAIFGACRPESIVFEVMKWKTYIRRLCLAVGDDVPVREEPE